MNEIIQSLIMGTYSDWFFNIFITNFFKFILNNFALLWLIAIILQKLAKLTKNKYDDFLAGKLVAFLTKIKGDKNEKINVIGGPAS